MATVAKDRPTPGSSIVPLTLSTTSASLNMRESQTNDTSQGTWVSERTRKKTNTSEISEEWCIVVRDKLAKMKDSVTHVTAQGGARRITQDVVEEYVAQCEKQLQPAKRPTSQGHCKQNWKSNSANARSKRWRRRLAQRKRQQQSLCRGPNHLRHLQQACRRASQKKKEMQVRRKKR